MSWLLDTNVVVGLLRDPRGRLAQRLRSHAAKDVAVSTVALFELHWGALRSARPAHNLAQVEALAFDVAQFDQDDAREAGRVRAELAAVGEPIGAYDLLIAGQARARGLTLVTANTREFARVRGLTIENWEIQTTNG